VALKKNRTQIKKPPYTGIACHSYLKCVYIIMVISMAITMPSAAQNILTLKQAINNGFLNRKNIQSGKSNLVIRKLQTDELYRKYYPQVSAEYTYLYNPILQTSILPIGVFNPSYPAEATKSIQLGTKWSQTVGLSANQPLLDLSIQRRINEAKLQELVTSASQEQSEYELAYTIAKTYITISLQESKIKSAIADTNRTWTSYLLQRNKFTEKRLLKSDLNKAKINHNNALQELKDAISEEVENKIYLLFLTGQSDIEKSDFMIDTTFGKEINLINPTITPSSLPELQQLELQAKLIDMQSKSEKSKHLPIISMKGFLGANQYTSSFDPVAKNSWFGYSYVGLNVKLPLLFGENQQKKLQELQLQKTQFGQQKDDKSAEYIKDAITSKFKIESVTSQLNTQQENIDLSIESIGIMQDRVIEGQESASSLNIDEANLQSLRAEYETNKKQLWVYWLNYLMASGQLITLWK
jgi:outer membrane protein